MLPSSLSPLERRARALTDLRMGLPVLVTTETDARLVFAVEALSTARLDAIVSLPDVDVAVTSRRAKTLKARVYDEDVARLALPSTVDLRWLHAVADPAQDLTHPMKGPFFERREGSAEIHRAGIALAKDARLLPSVIVVTPTEPVDAFTRLSVQEATPTTTPSYQRVTSAKLPTLFGGDTSLTIFRPQDGGEEHYAITVGRPDRQLPVLCRLHSACFTGDLLGSLKCDCGPQLQAALGAMRDAGSGVLLYLNQEGRGIGLANKMRAYALQDQGFDTVDANHRLGFEDDERDFRIGCRLLKQIGISDVRLLTNNPMKVETMQAHGITVTERVPIRVGETRENEAYLATKAKRSGHLL